MAISLQQVHRQSQQLIMTPQMQQSIQLLQMNTLELEQLAQQELLENPFLQLDEEGGEEGTNGPAESPGEAADRDASPADMDAASANGDSEGGAAAAEDMFTPIEREIHAEAGDDPGAMAAENDGGEIGGGEEMAPSLLNGASSGTAESAEPEPAEAETPDGAGVDEQPERFDEVDLNWEDYYDDSENQSYATDPNEEVHDFSEYTAAKVSLFEHLMWQLRLSVLEGKAYEVGEHFIGSLDDDGYISSEVLAEACDKFGVEMPEAERVLSVIQEFEPTGIAARNAAECLLIQMKALGSYSETARKAIELHFEDLQRKKFKNIARALDVPEEEIVAIHHKVSRLEPKPGRAYTKDSAHYIEPDVVVKLIDGRLSIYLNEGRSAHLSINRYYRRLLRLQAKALTKEEKAYATDKFRNALMLIKNIEKRKSTILRVTESIMEVQREFLDKGVEALKPLTLREVADMVGMHESTIARVTSKKYVETPQGLFALKFFFSSSISTSDGSGDAVSSRSIKDKLAGLVEKEDPRKPLSDQKIAEILNKEGFNIARRTVAKYREQLKILPAKLRKES